VTVLCYNQLVDLLVSGDRCAHLRTVGCCLSNMYHVCFPSNEKSDLTYDFKITDEIQTESVCYFKKTLNFATTHLAKCNIVRQKIFRLNELLGEL